MVKRIIYCETCEKFVELKRKGFDHMYHELLCILVLTVVLISIYFILRLSKKKNSCPNCETEFDLKNLPKPPDNLSIPHELKKNL